MCDCGSGSRAGGPYATGRELVEFVLAAHGGAVADSELPNGGLQLACHDCGEDFVLRTFVQDCPACGGVHAVSPPRANDAGAVQFAGADFRRG
ncbi:hypothetical protein GMLC_40850 [Geomonas limicola]|uniref:Uncharacterized protein n=1 Tax=Geomonas limicola TaxID=2740186 RepID=A0A6V8ND88_9BACT|nr:hypothetical protein [Geomonas limicola]GFO70506.1 hypothetical protein GMLC_40850 [Geomonas limicola]